MTYEWLNLITFPLCVTNTNDHCASAMSRDLSPGTPQLVYILKSLTQFVYSRCHLKGSTTKTKPCIGENSVQPCVGPIKFTALAQYHMTCAWGSPKPRVTIFNPELVIHYTTFSELWWKWLSLIVIIAPQMFFGVLVANNRFPKWHCFGNIKCSHRDPKRHIHCQTTTFDVFSLKIRSTVWAVAFLKNLKNEDERVDWKCRTGKKEGGNWRTTVAHKAKHACTRRTKGTDHSIMLRKTTRKH